MIVGLDRLVANANGGFVSGRYEVDGTTLYVSNGTGLWPGFALRLGRPSELTRITLRIGTIPPLNNGRIAATRSVTTASLPTGRSAGI
jgi:hypothetical protein